MSSSEPQKEPSLREWAFMPHAQLGFSTRQLEVQGLFEQFEALRDASERVVAADNQSLGAIGAEGERAMVEMTDALYELRVLLLESNPARRP